jgi:hypothetical protein
VPFRAAGERDLDLDDDFSLAGLWQRHLVDAQVARRVNTQRSHAAVW